MLYKSASFSISQLQKWKQQMRFLMVLAEFFSWYFILEDYEVTKTLSVIMV